MEIKQWIQEGCNYEKGVEIYAKLGRSVSMLRLFQRAETQASQRRLRYELEKLIQTKSTPVLTAIPVKEEKKKPIQKPSSKPPTKKKTVTVPVDSEELKRIKFKSISDYPLELHSVYKNRVSSFHEAVTLKMKLNELGEDEQEQALKIQLKIWDLLKTNSFCWNILNHYDETRNILPLNTSKDFSNLSPQELFNTRQKLYVNRTKRMATITKMQKAVEEETNEAKKQRKEVQLQKKMEELQVMENDIKHLSKLIKN